MTKTEWILQACANSALMPGTFHLQGIVVLKIVENLAEELEKKGYFEKEKDYDSAWPDDEIPNGVR